MQRGKCVYEKVPIEECWENAGRCAVGVKWVDTNKGDKENPEHRCRLVAKEIKKDQRGGLVCSNAPLRSEEDAAFILGEHTRDVFGFWRRSSCVPSR